MNSERWERISALFAEARAVPPDQWVALLDRSCGADAGIRAEVEKLLTADATSDRDGFLGSACPVSLTRLLDADDERSAERWGPSSGRRIGGYQLHNLIGQGGTSEVYEAGGPAGGRFAFKLIQGHMATEDVLRRFRAEQDLLATIDHPQIARFLDRGLTDDGLPYLVMEFIEGRRIDRYCDERELNLAGRVGLLLQVCRAVAFLHARGVLHRDLSPLNILVTPEGVPKLVDFGIARSAAHDPGTTGSLHGTAPGAILGTPEYLSPEQAMGRSSEADARSDVYTLGVLLYRLIAGRTPFQGLALANLLDAIRLSDPVPPSRFGVGIPRALEVICLTCLQEDPRRRYATASDLAGDLARWLDGRPIKARPVPMWVNALRWCRRRPAVAGLVAALAATVLVGFTVLFAFHRRAENHRSRAEEIRRQAEGNLEMAASMIRHLETLVTDRDVGLDEGLGPGGVLHYGSPVLGSNDWDRTAGLLIEQIPKVKSMSGFPPDLLLRLSRVAGAAAYRSWDLGRRDEARAIEEERLDLLRECRRRHPMDRAFVWETAATLLAVGRHEQEARRTDTVLNGLDRATALVLVTAGRDPRRLYMAAQLSAAYLDLEEQSVREGRPGPARRAADGPPRFHDLVTPEVGDGPAEMLFKACLVADRGEWDRAREAVEMLASKPVPVATGPRHMRAIEWGLSEWFAREVRRWNRVVLDEKSGPERWEREADDIVRLLARLSGTLEIAGGLSIKAIARMMDRIAMRAPEQRREGRLDQADRTIGAYLVLARRLVREFPGHPYAHGMLGQAFVQRSKNAWKRKDMGTIRRELTRAVKELEQAVSLGPEYDWLHEDLRTSKARLAALPGS